MQAGRGERAFLHRQLLPDVHMLAGKYNLNCELIGKGSSASLGVRALGQDGPGSGSHPLANAHGVCVQQTQMKYWTATARGMGRRVRKGQLEAQALRRKCYHIAVSLYCKYEENIKK